MDEETFIKLAKGYLAQEKYEDALHDMVITVATEHGQDVDFLGSSMGTNLVMTPVLDILGEDFSYFCYDCNKDFNKFNKGTTLADGTHPNIHSLSGLYKFAKEQGSIK